MCTIGIAKMVLNSVPEASRYRQFVLLKEKSYQCKGPPKKIHLKIVIFLQSKTKWRITSPPICLDQIKSIDPSSNDHLIEVASFFQTLHFFETDLQKHFSSLIPEKAIPKPVGEADVKTTYE